MLNEFGGEGSGGQSYLVYPWQAGVTLHTLLFLPTPTANFILSIYRFWLKVTPDGKGNTVYNCYFFDYKVRKWLLIASF